MPNSFSIYFLDSIDQTIESMPQEFDLVSTTQKVATAMMQFFVFVLSVFVDSVYVPVRFLYRYFYPIASEETQIDLPKSVQDLRNEIATVTTQVDTVRVLRNWFQINRIPLIEENRYITLRNVILSADNDEERVERVVNWLEGSSMDLSLYDRLRIFKRNLLSILLKLLTTKIRCC